MATVTNGTQTETRGAASAPAYLTGAPSEEGTGWVLFAGIMFMVSSMLNIIWGIAAVSNAHFFVGNASYILSDLNTWGWFLVTWHYCSSSRMTCPQSVKLRNCST